MYELVTIVVPTRDRKSRLLRTIATLAAQDYPAIEIIISDDGSQDGTCEAVTALCDYRIRVIRSTYSRGVSHARNSAIAEARGGWIAVCDDDDFWVPSKISSQIAYMKKHGGEWSFCQAVMVDDHLDIINAWAGVHDNQQFLRRIGYGNTVAGGCSSAIFSQSIFQKAGGGFDPQLSMLADWDMWSRLARISLPTPWPGYGTLYVMHGDQMSLNMDDIKKEAAIVRAKNADFRTTYRNPLPLEGIDLFIVRRLCKCRKWRSAIKHALDAAIHRRGVGFFRAFTSFLSSKKGGVENEAIEAVESVRSLLRAIN